MIKASRTKEKNKLNSLNERTGILNNRWVLALMLLCLVQLGAFLGLFNQAEMTLYDSWFRLRGAVNPGNEVIIAAIDDASIEKLGPPAWPRSVHAKLLEKLREARVVAFDLTFDTETKPEEDKTLAAAIARHGRVDLGMKFSYEKDEQGEVMQVFNPPLDEVMAGAAGMGFVNMPQDEDKVVRRTNLIDVNTFELPIPSLGLDTALVAAGIDPREIKVEAKKLIIRDKVIPLNDLNQAMPEFWGPNGTFKTYSYKAILDKLPASTFKDKIVLVGTTSVTEHDYYPTPYTTSNLVLSGSLPTPGVEIHAAVIQSFFKNIWYQRVSPGINLGFLLLVGGLMTMIVSRRGPWQGLLGALFMVSLTAAAVYLLWFYLHLWLNLAAPLLLILLIYAVMTAADFVQSEMGRRRTRAMFSRYVSEAVADELMRNPDKVSLGGTRQLVTIMFCDIRGFTAYSEKKDPEEVVARLNQYLTMMTDLIFKHGGTLDKYLGDGLMAVYGAPVSYPDHIERAVQTAIEIQEGTEHLNRQWQAEGQPALKIGVGINTGEVLMGNVGSSERMDYTAIGEDVNLASRVEGLTKTFNSLIVISERSVKRIGEVTDGKWKFEYLGHAEVKGFTDSIGVYTVKEEPDE